MVKPSLIADIVLSGSQLRVSRVSVASRQKSFKYIYNQKTVSKSLGNDNPQHIYYDGTDRKPAVAASSLFGNSRLTM